MKVNVKLFAAFRQGRFREKVMELEDDCKVGQVIDQLAIPRREVGIIFVNGLSAETDNILQDGDTLSIFPMLGGG